MAMVNVVTGASSGVGRALCLHFAGQGERVLGLARRAGELADVKAEYPDLIEVVACDLASPDGRVAAAAALGRDDEVGTLTHSAAIASLEDMRDMTGASYHAMMAINLEAPLFLTRDLLPRMAQGGRVLHLSSGSAHRTLAGNGLYCISKAALLMAKDAWNADLAGSGVTVGSAMPGVVIGPMQDSAREGDHPSASVFRGFRDEGLLIRPERVAQFLYWVLKSTGDEAFAAGDWNIFDEAHHAEWLDGPLSG
ncbi:SDR family oxidoreductase [Croceicoccus gelatinilyticus]|uniref:SDR family oxidoreductase n=1 Tax=Croceicoccus gelatinilyticus TaxID=2835536 RepID=UPI001BCDC4DC|nr:SDR family oxidoreductase [Croceicoccus gelatinilyticus]MBS7670712.1 SDR family oxidoreductase [Croceicoccus gelatinilyticus]